MRDISGREMTGRMVRVVFEFKDQYTNGKWVRQECTVSHEEECISLYGLDDPDVEYRIIKVEDARKR